MRDKPADIMANSLYDLFAFLNRPRLSYDGSPSLSQPPGYVGRPAPREEVQAPVKEREEEKKEKSWGDYFTEPMETLYILTEDNQLFKYTDSEEKGIDFNTQALQMWLKSVNKKRGTNYSVGNIKMILHNHLKDSKFSDKDHKTYRDLTKSGFNGQYMMYSNLSKKVYNINEEFE